MNQEQGLNSRNSPLILVVDDEPDNFDVIENLLRDCNYDLLFEPNSDKALKIFRETNPDIVMLDVMMPGIDGMSLCQELRKESDVPIIMVTALSAKADEARLLQAGADYYVPKPINGLQLRAVVISLINNKSLIVRENHRLKNINTRLREKNEKLEKDIDDISNGRLTSKDRERYEKIASGIAHSLKGELFNIGNSVREIKKLAIAINSSDIQEEYDIIERSVESSHILLRRLLNYLNTGHCQKKIIRVAEILNKLELIVRPRITSNINLNISIEAGVEDKEVDTDLEQVMMVLTELISNATKALRNLDQGAIDIFFSRQSEQLTISIEDNGSGIPENIREKLFKEYVPSKNGLGLGVGLFLCNKVIEDLGGKLGLESSSKGARSTIVLPIATPN
jgi:two-component system, sensor histidine kinase and response regulator